MIPAPRLNALRPIELLQQHDPRQMMGEGHIGEGETQICEGLDFRGNAEAGAEQEAGGGYRVYEIPTPALITASKPDYDPRYPSIKSKMAARKAKIATISAADIGLDAAAVAPKVEYLGFSAPPKRAAGVKVQEAEPVDAVNKAMEILIAAKVI